MSAKELKSFYIGFLVECPYCNFKNGVFTGRIPVDQHGMNVLLCGIEDGGCDKWFAYKLDIKVQSQSYKIDTVSKEVQ